MNKGTEKKLKEILERLSQGETKESIIKNKFNRSKKAYKEFIERVKGEIPQEERELLEMGKRKTEETQNIEPVPLTPSPSPSALPLKELLNDPQHLKTFEKLILRGGELLELLEPNQRGEDIHILKVPEGFIELKDLKISSKRISKHVEKAFNELAADHKQYSKTSLLNLALWEFVEKYKK